MTLVRQLTFNHTLTLMQGRRRVRRPCSPAAQPRTWAAPAMRQALHSRPDPAYSSFRLRMMPQGSKDTESHQRHTWDLFQQAESGGSEACC